MHAKNPRTIYLVNLGNWTQARSIGSDSSCTSV